MSISLTCIKDSVLDVAAQVYKYSTHLESSPKYIQVEDQAQGYRQDPLMSSRDTGKGILLVVQMLGYQHAGSVGAAG